MTAATGPAMQRGPAPVRRGTSAIALSSARARLLEHLQQLRAEVSAEDVATQFGQHPNTVREHLDALVGAGLVLRQRQPGPGRGRPAWRYRANPDHPEPDPRVREHSALVGALAAHIATHSPDPRAEAREAGQRWGRALIPTPPGASDDVGDPAPASDATAAPVARRRVVDLLADLDFGPQPTRTATRVVLTTCPLLDVARAHPQVVCAVHEGMVAGALHAMRAPAGPVTLTPFGTPEGCLLTMP